MEYALGNYLNAGHDYAGDITGAIVGAIVGANPGPGTPTIHRGPHAPMHGRPMHPAAHPGAMHPAHHFPHGYNPPVVHYDGFQPTKMRKSQVGVPVGIVPNGGVQDFTTQPQKPFRPERLVIPSSIGPAFTLTDFKVGNTSQFVSSNGDIPALAYSEQAVGVEILSDTAFISQFLVLSARNISANPQIFSAGFFGTSVDQLPRAASRPVSTTLGRGGETARERGRDRPCFARVSSSVTSRLKTARRRRNTFASF